MSDFLFSINATVPIFLVILLGWFLKRIGLINDEFANIANKYVFKVSLPVLLFRDIATTSVLKDVNMKFTPGEICGVLFLRNFYYVCMCMVLCKDILPG